MRTLSQVTCYLIWFSTLVTCFIRLPTILPACAPRPPDPWFTERITIVPANLPPGVGVRIIQMTRDDSTSDYVEITNSSSTTLYVIGKPWSPNRILVSVPLTLPAGVGPTHKIVNQQVFTWQPYAGTPQAYPVTGNQRTDAVFLKINDNILQSDEAAVIDLAPHNRTGDARPADVRLPDAQTVTFPLIYGTQLIQVPISVSYMLNPSYRPNSVASPPDGCRRTTIIPALGVCLAVLLTVVLVLGGLRYRQRNVGKTKIDAIP
jgi:hypothetical protein